jgi:hypothetical protein
MVRALMLLAIGSLVGVVVEVFARGQRASELAAIEAQRAPPVAAAPPAPAPSRPAASATAAGNEPFQCTGGPVTASSSAPPEPDPKGAAAVAHHHHHRTQPAGPAGTVAESSPAEDADAGLDGDDLAAAMRALSQAKGEVTIP